MAVIQAYVRHWFLGFVLLAQQSAPMTLISEWSSGWWANRINIASIAAVNVALTTGSEIVTRTVAAPFFGREGKNFGFIVTDHDGSQHINRQSLINILMTLVATMMGAPLYYFAARRKRFVFFMGIACLNTIFAQAVCSRLLDGAATLSSARILFDLAYNASIKFGMFELFRKSIVHAEQCVVKIGKARVKQDVFTSLIKVTLLNLLKFKG